MIPGFCLILLSLLQRFLESSGSICCCWSPILTLFLKHVLTSSLTWDPLITNEDEETKDNPYHLLGDQSLTVVLSRTDFPFPSRGHMVRPKIPSVTVAMTVSRSLPLEGSNEGHDRTPTVHAKVPHNKEFTYPSTISTRTQEPWSASFVGFPPFYKTSLFDTIMIFNKLQERQQS